MTLYDFMVSWEKLSTPSESIAGSGYPAGAELIDYFSVRIADSEGEQRGTCTWTFVQADAQGKHIEQVFWIRLQPRGYYQKCERLFLKVMRNCMEKSSLSAEGNTESRSPVI